MFRIFKSLRCKIEDKHVYDMGAVREGSGVFSKYVECRRCGDKLPIKPKEADT